MASSIRRNCSSRRGTPLMQGGIVIAFDAMKNRNFEEFTDIITDVLKEEDMIEQTSTITFLGVLDKVLHPMGFQIQIGPKSFVGAHVRAIKEEVSRKVDALVKILKQSAEECEDKGVEIKVKIAVGAPMKNTLVEQILDLQATWAILDRQLKKELRFYLKHIPCKVAHVHDDLSLEVLRPYYIDMSIETMKYKLLYSLCKPVPLPPTQDDESDKNSQPLTPMKSSDIPNGSVILSSTPHSKDHIVSLDDESGINSQHEISGSSNEVGNKCNGSPQVIQKEREQHNPTEVAVISTDDTLKTGQDAVGPGYSEIQMEPGEYSSDTSPEEGLDAKVEHKHDKIYSDAPVLGTADNKINKDLNSLGCSCSNIQTATDDFSCENFLGEGLDAKVEHKHDRICSDAPVLGTADNKIHMDLNSLGCSYSNIQTATDDFACENFLGEGGYGVVYKGKLNDGQLIAVKVQTEADLQSSAEFQSEFSALSFARHMNIVTLIGYCCKENLKILIYEYMSNKSLKWHLFDDTVQVLEWNQRRDIAIGTAKGLRFLHEECRGGPIIHQDIRPCNIFLTHDFVPLLGDCGLAKWKTNKFDKERRNVGNIAYLAPEYEVNNVCSVKTDVYAFGIVLIQLISGRKAVESTGENHQQPIRQWALSLIQTLALHDLVDPRIGDAYNTYDLYSMARAAHLCVQTKPASRPTMGEVLCVLEGRNDHLRHVKSNLYPMIISADS